VTVLLQMLSLIQKVKKVLKSSMFDEVKAYQVKAYKIVCQFFGHPVHV